jgi:hypothetical protein
MDLNYAFDPFAQLKRLFRTHRDMTLLIDEAHHTADRVRESLTGEWDSGVLREHRTAVGKALGRKHPYYKAISALLKVLCAQESPDGAEEWRADTLPEALNTLTGQVQEEAVSLLSQPSALPTADLFRILRLCMPFLYAAQRLEGGDYAILWQRRGKERCV